MRGLLIAALLLCACTSSEAAPSPSAQAAINSESTSPNAALAVGAVRSADIDARYGVLIATRDSLLVRRETDGQLLHTMPLYTRAFVGYAVSGDGRYVAYWARTSQSVQDHDLRVYDAATGGERVVLHEVSALYLPSSIAWASDQSGVAYGVVALAPRRDLATRPSEVRITDLASGQTRTLYRAEEEGSLLLPIAWDREQRLIGTVRLGTTQMPERYLRISESGIDTRIDAAPITHGSHSILGPVVGDSARGYVAAIDAYKCSGGDQPCTQLRVSPIEREFGGTGPTEEPGSIARLVRFIPSSRHVLELVDRPSSAGTRLELVDPSGRQLTVTLREWPDPRREREVFVRPDGASAYVFELDGAGWTGELIPLSGGAPRSVPRWDARGRPVNVVTLDASEAQRVRALPAPSHLLTLDEVAALPLEGGDVRVDSAQAALVSGALPPNLQSGAGVIKPGPAWVVVRTGEFNWRGTIGVFQPQADQPCQVWIFDARTGSPNGYALGPLSTCTATLASASFVPIASHPATPARP
jgi:hypothetical protein